jgi:hypothetical protein
MICHIRAIDPNDHETHALKFLLMNRTGCSSFESLRTIDGIVYKEFVDAERELKIAYKEDDAYYNTIRENREENYWFEIILEIDILDHFIENFDANNDLENYYSEQLLIAFELGYF